MASGNDASVALAEKIAGTEAEFVRMMNETRRAARAEEHPFRQLQRPARQRIITRRLTISRSCRENC